MVTLKYKCARCGFVQRLEVEAGDHIKKSMRCWWCKVGRMRLPKASVSGGSKIKHKFKKGWW